MIRLLLMALVIWLLYPATSDAITRNSTTYTKCATNPCTDTHTVAGTDPFLAVCVAWWHYSSTPIITSATWNGLALTLQKTVSNTSCISQCSVALYTLTAPTAATANTSISFSGSFNAAIVGTVSYNGVDQTTSVGTGISNTGSGSPASVTVPSNSGELVMDCLGSMSAGAAPTVASGQTANWSDFDSGGYMHGASSYLSGTPSTVMAWTISGTPQWAMVGLPIRPATTGGGGGGSPPGTTQRVISWNDNSDNETCFHLQWQTDQSTPNWVDINACLPPNTISVAHDIGVSTGDCYRVEATNTGGSSGFTASVCAATVQPPTPEPVGVGLPTAIQFDFEEDLL